MNHLVGREQGSPSVASRPMETFRTMHEALRVPRELSDFVVATDNETSLISGVGGPWEHYILLLPLVASSAGSSVRPFVGFVAGFGTQTHSLVPFVGCRSSFVNKTQAILFESWISLSFSSARGGLRGSQLGPNDEPFVVWLFACLPFAGKAVALSSVSVLYPQLSGV